MLIEGLGAGSLTNGVLRIETFSLNAKGEKVAGEELHIPASVVPRVTQMLNAMVKQLSDQIRADQEAKTADQ